MLEYLYIRRGYLSVHMTLEYLYFTIYYTSVNTILPRKVSLLIKWNYYSMTYNRISLLGINVTSQNNGVHFITIDFRDWKYIIILCDCSCIIHLFLPVLMIHLNSFCDKFELKLPLNRQVLTVQSNEVNYFCIL